MKVDREFFEGFELANGKKAYRLERIAEGIMAYVSIRNISEVWFEEATGERIGSIEEADTRSFNKYVHAT